MKYMDYYEFIWIFQVFRELFTVKHKRFYYSLIQQYKCVYNQTIRNII